MIGSKRIIAKRFCASYSSTALRLRRCHLCRWLLHMKSQSACEKSPRGTEVRSYTKNTPGERERTEPEPQNTFLMNGNSHRNESSNCSSRLECRSKISSARTVRTNW